MTPLYQIGDTVEVRQVVTVKSNGVFLTKWKQGIVLGVSRDARMYRVRHPGAPGGWCWYTGSDMRPFTPFGVVPPVSSARLPDIDLDHQGPVSRGKRVLHDCCPTCQDRGEWRGCALVCRQGHGVFAG